MIDPANEPQRGLYPRLERAFVLVLATAAIAVATMFACLLAMQVYCWLRYEPDPALWNRNTLPFAFMYAAVIATIACPFMLLFLLPTPLHKSLPVVALVAIGATALLTTVIGLLSVFVGLPLSLAAMVWCRNRYGRGAWRRAKQPAR